VGGTIGVDHASHWWDNLCPASGFIESWKKFSTTRKPLNNGQSKNKEIPCHQWDLWVKIIGGPRGFDGARK
jgi:hypothetical protein